MDLLGRRTTTRRGTLVAGGNNKQSSGSAAATAASSPAKTALLHEFRAHEEAQAACVLQRSVRSFLARRWVAALLRRVYRRQYDPIAKAYCYVNTQTNETTWDKPKALQLFLRDGGDVPVVATAQLSPSLAASKIQRLVRAFVAVRFVHRLVHDKYMKLFDPQTNTFYYLDTVSGEKAATKPRCLPRDADLPVETFRFRQAVCKVSSPSNLYGTGVVGVFGAMAWLVLLCDARTLPDAEAAREAHVLCNFADSGVPFPLPLLPHAFFLSVELDGTARFALCAIDKEAFTKLAGDRISPVRLMIDDRKLGCTADVRVRDAIEVVGHPHGKARVVHARSVARLLPSAIAPLKIQYDAPMESGSAGSAVFTRSGKLLGVQPFTPLKDPPPVYCYAVRAILEAANARVTPPEPFLLTTRIGANEINVCWSIPRWHKAPVGLPFTFELELCRPGASTSGYDKFEAVYRGDKRSKHIGELLSGTTYSLRVRCVNAVARGKWSHVMKLVTLPPPSLAWRIPRYCASVAEACKRLKQQRHDAEAQRQCVQWMARYLDQHAESMEAVESEFTQSHAVDLLLQRVADTEDESFVLVTLRVLTTLTQQYRQTQRLLSQVARMQSVLALVMAYKDSSAEIRRHTVALLGAVLDGDNNASAQQTAQAIELVPQLLALVDATPLAQDPLFIGEVAFLLARYTHNHTRRGKWQLVEDGRLHVLRDLLDAYEISYTSIAFWLLVALGNVGYGSNEDPPARQQLEDEIASLGLIGSICRVRRQFLEQLDAVQHAAATAQREWTRLAATVMGEEMRNEMDALEHEYTALYAAKEAMEVTDGNVAHAADFALRYLLTENQRQVQQASQRIMAKFMMRKTAAAFAQWQIATLFLRNVAIMRAFLTNVRHRQLAAGFRRWESAVREFRKQAEALARLSVGLAIDLNKGKRERYRMLVLQK